MTQVNLSRVERALENPAAVLMVALGALLAVAFFLLGA
jgi:hypothetical protein